MTSQTLAEAREDFHSNMNLTELLIMNLVESCDVVEIKGLPPLAYNRLRERLDKAYDVRRVTCLDMENGNRENILYIARRQN